MSGALQVDLHVKVLDESVVQRAKDAGLDAIVFAPHFTRLPEIQERAAAFSDDELLVVPGREVFAGSWRSRTHVLAVGLQDPVPDFITLSSAMAEFDRQGAAVLAPHPTFGTMSLGVDDLRAYRDEIHAVETFNPKHLRRHNRRAAGISETLSIPAFASSYAHLRGTVGAGWTSIPDTPPDTDALVDALRRRVPRSVKRAGSVRHRLQCALERSHLLYENSWEKFDRVILSGTDATHPHHPAYEGRFDDVCVY